MMMDAAGLTGQRLAELLGRSAGYVSERRTGKAAWTLDDVDVIAEQLGIDGLALLRDVAERLERPSAGDELAQKRAAKPRKVPGVAKTAARKDKKPGE